VSTTGQIQPFATGGKVPMSSRRRGVLPASGQYSNLVRTRILHERGPNRWLKKIRSHKSPGQSEILAKSGVPDIAIPETCQRGERAPTVEYSADTENDATQNAWPGDAEGNCRRPWRIEQPSQRHCRAHNPQHGFGKTEKHVRTSSRENFQHRFDGTDARTLGK